MKNKLQLFTLISISFLLFLIACKKENEATESITNLKTSLGKKIFIDTNLSEPAGQSCSSCHASATGFSDPEHNIVSPGAVNGLFGNRNAPMVTYCMYIPSFHFSNADSSYHGGFFWDGRVNTLEEQAQKPFMNPLEMNNSSAAMLMKKIRNADYYSLFNNVYGNVSDDNTAFNNIADAIACYESSPELNPFTSKYDYYLKGQATLSAQEQRGLILFKDSLKSKCGNCHVTTPDNISGKVLFTDFSYNNDGVPKNTYNPFYSIPAAFNALGSNYIDYGLGSILNNHNQDGKFRVPSLRNIAITSPYFHNGVFGTLEEVVHFYNTRDLAGAGFAKPEVIINIDTAETGNLHLTAMEEADIVAFMKSLTDGYTN